MFILTEYLSLIIFQSSSVLLTLDPPAFPSAVLARCKVAVRKVYGISFLSKNKQLFQSSSDVKMYKFAQLICIFWIMSKI